MAKKFKLAPLSDQIRAAILKDGRPLLQIANLTGLDYSALHKFTHGKRGMSLESLDKIGDVCHLEIRQWIVPSEQK